MSTSRGCEVSFNSGTIYHIHEVINPLSRPPIGSSVKLLGQIDEKCLTRVKLSLGEASIEVSTRFLSGVDLETGMMYHIIGELEESEIDSDSIQLNARVVCDAQGLDVNLWKEALKIRREFLSHRESNQK